MRQDRLAFAAGLALLVVAVMLVLLQAPVVVARTNRPPGQLEEPIDVTTHDGEYCQDHELLPRSISAIRVWLAANSGPRVKLTVVSGGRQITGGEREAGWTGAEVTVPVKPLHSDVSDVSVCASFDLKDETILVQGDATPPEIAARNGARRAHGRMWIDYLQSGKRSWASLIPAVVRNMGFGRSLSGTGIIYIALLLLLGMIALVTTAVLRDR